MAAGTQVSTNPQSAALWPHEEALKLRERVRDYDPGRPVMFESGFGPSGLPHLGTMCEVLRPSYVRRAFQQLETQRATRLIVFIDDMDGLRKVPENIPRREETARHLGEPVSRIPDPFGECHPSFADHMISLLGDFLAPVEVDYELMRSSEMYQTGKFDQGLRLILEKHQEIIAIVAPTLREENRAGWSPIMPLCPECGQIVERQVLGYYPDRATVEVICQKSAGGANGCGWRGELSILGGQAKAQWKVDWALRWYALAVDYELYGKDLIDSARLSGQILKVMGGKAPLGFPFEMFLDEEGHKVSKSVGRGVTVDQWQRYAPIEVLKYFLLLNPRRAKKLFLETIPQYVDEYLDALREYASAPNDEARRNLPLDMVLQKESPRRFDSQLSFGMMMNLVGALGSSDREFIWNYLRGYDSAIESNPPTATIGRALVDCTINYYRDFIEPAKQPFAPDDAQRGQLQKLVSWLDEHREASAEEIEKKLYDLGRENYDKPGKIFPVVYRALLGQERGPRLGAFIRLATPTRVVELLNEAIAR
ncbi:MAG TPA: lysine--tRNA ligase [Candidatus Binataceae bacterium]|nr:lysine--tRNA ligase [Candidatus Binataceae bacterium]